MLIDGGEAEQDRLDNVDEFVSGVIEYMKNNEEPTLTGFLEETALVADVDRFDETADAVVLMTIHSAKGLEFPVAIIPGLEEGIFPGTQSMNDPGELEEERRLAYVAITRAKKELFLFHSGRRLLYGRTMYNPISRFVGDIPAELIDEKVKKQEKPSEFSWGGGKTYIGGSSSSGTMRPVQKPGTVPAKPIQRPAVAPKTAPMKKPSVVFNPGDRVKHMAFGEGEVISAKQMGSDVMYEVVFDNVGTKKLMATYAKLTKA
jgi:DNA helicase-2/ATP-dependent DNA helicase PcrA